MALEEEFPDLISSCWRAAATTWPPRFSPELVDVWIYVIGSSIGGDKIPTRAPGNMRLTCSSNKIDLAPLVGASLKVMARDASTVRGDRPFVFCNLHAGDGLTMSSPGWSRSCGPMPYAGQRLWDGRLSSPACVEYLARPPAQHAIRGAGWRSCCPTAIASSRRHPRPCPARQPQVMPATARWPGMRCGRTSRPGAGGRSRPISTLLEPVAPETVRANPDGYAAVVAGSRRHRVVTGLAVKRDAAPGWIGVVHRREMALWIRPAPSSWENERAAQRQLLLCQQA